MSKGRVLLLEEDATLRELFVELLELADYEVLGFNSLEDLGASAVSGIPEQMAVVDVWQPRHVPQHEGLVECLRNLAGTLPILVLTDRSFADERSFDTIGAAGLVAFPFDLDTVLASVERTFASRRANGVDRHQLSASVGRGGSWKLT